MFPYEQQTEAEYSSLQRRQVVVWLFLILLIIGIVGGIFFIIYGVLKGGGEGTSGGGSFSVVTPITQGLEQLFPDKRKDRAGSLFFAELSPADGRYHLYRIRAEPFLKEEIFSFPWADPSVLPAFKMQGGYIGVFFKPGEGVLLKPDGKLVGLNELPFQPPYVDHSISPDGSRMIYFKHFSTVGTTSATVHDMARNADVFAWPIGSEASHPCDFVGWSSDSRRAYCISSTASRTDVRSFDVRGFSYAAVVSAAAATDAHYYPDRDVFLYTTREGVFLFDGATKERKRVLQASDGSPSNAMLTPDGARIVYTADGSVRIFTPGEGSGRELVSGAKLVALSPDGAFALVETGEGRFTLADIQGSAVQELFAAAPELADARYLGWLMP